MTKQNEQEDIIEDLPEDVEEGVEDNTDWKALAKKNQGIAKRLKTKNTKLTETAKETKKAKSEVKKPKSKDTKESFDYAEKAYLKTSVVKPEEFKLVKKIMDSTGKTLDEVLESKYFRSEPKELREDADSKAAVPSGTKRTAPSTKDKVSYWLAKGEMPPADQPKLRREYVNAKMTNEQQGSKYTDRPIIQ